MDEIRITQDEADALIAARYALNEIRDRTWKGILAGTSDGPAAYNLGRLNAEADAADNAVFGVLSCLSSYHDDPLASATIQRWYDEREAARQAS